MSDHKNFSQAYAPVQDSECVEAYQHWLAADKNKAQAARNMGLSRQKFRSRLDSYFKRGLNESCPVDVNPGMAISGHSVTLDKSGEVRSQSVKMKPDSSDEFTIPEDYLLERGTFQTNGQGQLTQQWLKLKKDAAEIQSVADVVKDYAKEIPALELPDLQKIRRKSSFEKNSLTLHPLPDMHLGMFAWAKETHDEDWDLSIACTRFKSIMDRVMDKSPKSAVGVVLGGGDLVHADNMDNMTRRSSNALDVDSRYPKVVKNAIELCLYQVELARQNYEKVGVRILPGNHDEHVATAVTYSLWAWYRDVPQVEVDIDPSLFWFFEHGNVMLAATHGHRTRIGDLPAVMAGHQAPMWGRTEFRYGHGFHIHHKSKMVDEFGGAICETHQAPIPSDAYHAGGPWVSGRSMQSITYDSHEGEIDRVTVNVRRALILR